MKWLDKNQNKILIGIWSAIFLTCLFVIFSEPVHAESSNSLPYIVDNNISVIDFANAFNGHPHQTNNTLTISSDNCFVFEFTSNNVTYYYVYVPKKLQVPTRASDPYSFYVSYLSVPYSGFNISTDTATISAGNYAVAQFYVNGSGNLVYQTVYLSEYITRGLNIFYNSSYTPVYICREVLDSSDNVVLGLSSNQIDITGHSQPPVDDNGHYIEDGNGNRIPKPNKPTPSVFTPPTIQYPTVDISSLEKLVESLIDLVQYFISYIGGVINGWFSNLLSNLDSWFDYVVQSFNYAINNVVGAIKDLASTFYNNMVSLFEPFYEFLSGVASFFNHLIVIGTVDGAFNLANIVTYLFLPDSSAIYPIFVSHDEFNIIGITNHLFDEYRLFMSRVESINTLHYIMIPSFTFHGQTIPQTRIDFSWFENYKVYTDGVISAFLIVGYVYYLFTRISGWLRGNQGDVYVGDNSSNYHGTKIGF